MDIPYRNPNNITEESLNDAVKRQSTSGSRLCGKKWINLSEECVTLLKTIARGGYPYNQTISIFCLGLQVGFDLHAKHGDSGNAEIYAEKEKEETKDGDRS